MPRQNSFGPRLEITWHKPRIRNGIIRKYTLIYDYNKNTKSSTKRVDVDISADRNFVINVTMMGILTYKISATTVKEGPYTIENVTIPAYGKIYVHFL